jgi:2,4-dienoyl-CoA reductase-like NADH-dependent reductase (Old Yellow Enzyme family)
MHPHLFSKIAVGGKELKNRLTMAPLYLGYAGVGGTVSDLVLEHYRLMAKSGVAMVVVEKSTVDHPAGSGSNRTLRADTDENMGGLTNLAASIKAQGTLACLQINHAGRIAAGGLAERIVADGKADLIGLARVLRADPEWPTKVKEGRENEIIHCHPDCDETCTKLVTKGKFAFCVCWPHDKLQEWKGKIV